MDTTGYSGKILNLCKLLRIQSCANKIDEWLREASYHVRLELKKDSDNINYYPRKDSESIRQNTMFISYEMVFYCQ